MLVFKLLLMGAFSGVFWQDVKQREVYWFLFPVIALCCGVLLFNSLAQDVFLLNTVINLLCVAVLLTVVWLYSKFKLKTSIKNTFGLGDGLLFVALAFSFTTLSFIILFVFGLVFSLVIHLILRQHQNDTVPLAGYLSLFFGITYLAYWLGVSPLVYTF